MVFFNYSTMQMAAKIVYYGPGLCGKTTNLQHIYSHTSRGSRGEMVSLETETDRTLFFDLLPLDVGSIQGFNTRIQLYTVPGQVFYNTTRKLVLKGVDGVVFVADSQRPMMQANVESFSNLEQNLAEIGLSVDQLPLVLQYNKRDLSDICTVEELDRAINRGAWPAFEAAALHGQGVFETLKGISKLTLLSLKKRIAESQRRDGSLPGAEVARSVEAKAEPVEAPSAPAPAAPSPAPEAQPPTSAAAQPESAAPAAAAPSPAPSARRGVDILAELDKIRKQALGSSPQSQPTESNGSRRIDHDIDLRLSRDHLSRAKRFSLSLDLHDENDTVVDSFKRGVDLDDVSTLDQLLLRLNIALHAEE